MAEPALPRAEPHRAAPRSRMRPPNRKLLRPWLDAGMPLREWLASLEDDPPPGEDTIPMIEPHAEAVCYTRDAFVHHFREPSASGRQAEVGFDLPVKFRLVDEHGIPHQGRLSPDVLVAFNAEHRPERRDYDAESLPAPDFVLEVLSKTTWKRDVDAKLKTYAAIGVRECFLFDPTGRFPVPDLQGWTLTKRRIRPLPTTRLDNGAEAIRSRVLNLLAYIDDERTPSTTEGAQAIRWHDPATSEDLPTYAESREQAAAARAEAEAAQRRVVELESRLANLGR